MKRNRTEVKLGRQQRGADAQGNSKYAKKVARGEQMYGPGCCAHRIRVRAERREEEFVPPPSSLAYREAQP